MIQFHLANNTESGHFTIPAYAVVALEPVNACQLLAYFIFLST